VIDVNAAPEVRRVRPLAYVKNLPLIASFLGLENDSFRSDQADRKRTSAQAQPSLRSTS
jgi:hypothetical protein